MLIFTLCAAMLIGFGSLQPDNLPLTFNNITLRISGESTEATISRAWRDSREPQNAKNKFYHVKYDFITNAGDTYSGKSFLDRKKSKRYSAGETIKVLYDPKNPSNSVVFKFSDNAFIIMFFTGLLFLCILIAVVFIFKSTIARRALNKLKSARCSKVEAKIYKVELASVSGLNSMNKGDEASELEHNELMIYYQFNDPRGQKYKGNAMLSSFSSVPPLEKGDSILVRYDNNNPNINALDEAF